MFKVSRKVQDLFDTPVPHELWHYTTVDGLKGIVSSGKVWATEARFTSDPTEYVFLRDVAIEFLKAKKQKQRLESVGLDADALLELMDIHYEKGVLSPGFADVFIASFSAAEDLKSQWIDYGMAYGGSALRLTFSKQDRLMSWIHRSHWPLAFTRRTDKRSWSGNPLSVFLSRLTLCRI